MKIWHSGAHWSPLGVNGVNAMVYSVARAQTAFGHDVSLLIPHPPDEAGLEFARETGVQLLEVPPSVWSYGRNVEALIANHKPDIVHMHSVYIPQQAALARVLVRRNIPYMITPNGGVSPWMLARNRMKKALYNALIERRRFQRATCISVVTPGELDEVRSFVPGFKGAIAHVPNPVADPGTLENREPWTRKPQRPKLVYMGRFDVRHKGIDILLRLARELPEADLHLFGSEDARTKPTLEALKRDCSPNVSFHSPVFGEAKVSVLAQATLYVQMSRWEAFGISVAEAMYLGLPCALSSSMHITRLFEQNHLGLVLPDDPLEAGRAIRAALLDEDRLHHWSQRASRFAREHFHPAPVAERYLYCYERSIAG
jgi:glycosyltransferase involved in cell wall biosynthesis